MHRRICAVSQFDTIVCYPCLYVLSNVYHLFNKKRAGCSAFRKIRPGFSRVPRSGLALHSS